MLMLLPVVILGRCVGPQLGGNINALLEQDALEQRVLVAQHQHLISGLTGALLQTRELFLVVLDGRLEMLDIFRSSFSECYILMCQ